VRVPGSSGSSAQTSLIMKPLVFSLEMSHSCKA
jgi:hypothetical protein